MEQWNIGMLEYWEECGALLPIIPTFHYSSFSLMALGCGRGLLSCLAAAKTASPAPPILISVFESNSRFGGKGSLGWLSNYYARAGRLGQACYD